MFTANSMNCLTEALGLSLPGNGSTLATHADRKTLFLRAGAMIVEMCRRHYEEDDDRVLPRTIARSEEHTSELQSLMRISYAVFCLIKNILSMTRLSTSYKSPPHTPHHHNNLILHHHHLHLHTRIHSNLLAHVD